MQLFTAEQVVDRKTTADRERIERTARLNDEENKASRALNETVARSTVETARIMRELGEFSAAAETKKRTLLTEIESLEERRKTALKPIKEQRAEAERMLVVLKEQEAELKNEGEMFKSRYDEVMELKESLADQKAELDEREKAIQLKEDVINTASEMSVSSQRKLSAKWVEFYQTVAIANNDLKRKELEIENGRKTNQEFKKSLDAESARLKTERLALQDGYASLGRARKEILGRTT